MGNVTGRTTANSDGEILEAGRRFAATVVRHSNRKRSRFTLEKTQYLAHLVSKIYKAVHTHYPPARADKTWPINTSIR